MTKLFAGYTKHYNIWRQTLIFTIVILCIIESHYTGLLDEEYRVGDPIKIPTISDSKLERPRQFEVKLSYSVSTPLIVVQPDTAIVTIKDRNGMLQLHAFF
jgi:hypothetical protein